MVGMAGVARAQVYVHDSPAAADLLIGIDARARDGEWSEAARLAQEVNEAHGRKLLEQEAGLYVDARIIIERKLRSSPELITAYRDRFGSVADRALLDAGRELDALRGVAQRFWLTDAGLTAGMRVAGSMMEAGDFDSAAPWLADLNRHLARDSHLGLLLELRAICAGYRGEGEEYNEHRQALAELDRAAAGRLDVLMGTVAAPTGAVVRVPLDVLPDVALPASLDAALWMHESLGVGRTLMRMSDGAGEVLRDPSGQRPSVVPSARGSTIYANSGLHVRAIDAASGAIIWQYEDPAFVALKRQLARVQRGGAGGWPSQVGASQHVVIPTGDRLVAITGLPVGLASRMVRSGTDADALTCLRADREELCWRLTPGEVDGQWQHADWVGRPVIQGGVVFATIQNLQESGFADAYLVAVSLESGKPIWLRHLASVPFGRSMLPQVVTDIEISDGRLYVTAQPGAVAALSPVDGTIHWLVTLPSAVPVAEGGGRFRGRYPSQSVEVAPWQNSYLVDTTSGLIVLDRAGNRTLVIDRDTGHLLDTIATGVWDHPNQIASIDGDVLALGDSLTRLDGATLDPIWSSSTSGAGAQQGQWSLTHERLYLPTATDVRVIRLSDGVDEPSLSVGRAINVLVLDDQLIAADAESIASYSTWDAAANRLMEVIGLHPEDMAPRLSLLRLALQAHRYDQFMASLDETLAVVSAHRADPEGQESLFDMLLDLASTAPGIDTAMRGAVFDRLEQLAGRTEQEVAFHLAAAAFAVEQGRHESAMGHYQTLLMVPAYRDHSYRDHEGGVRRVGLEVQRRLIELLGEGGRGEHRAFERSAQARLEALGVRADVEQWIGIAESFPGTEAATEALMRAAKQCAAERRFDGGLALLSRTRRQVTEADRVRQIDVERAEILVAMHRPDRAIAMLRRWAAADPPVALMRGGEAIDAATWIQELKPRIGSDLPNTGLGGSDARVEKVEGRVLGVVPGRDAGEGRWLALHGKRLEMRDVGRGDLIWSDEVGSAEVTLLRISDEGIWLSRAGTQRIECRDTNQGDVRWTSDNLRNVFQEMGATVETAELERGRDAIIADLRRMQMAQGNVDGGELFVLDEEAGQLLEAVQMGAAEKLELLVRGNDGEAGRPILFDGQIGRLKVRGKGMQAVVGPGAVAILGPVGELMVLDAWTGAILWQAHPGVVIDGAMEVSDAYVAVTGRDVGGQRRLIVYDVHTGAVVHQVYSSESDPVQWMGLTDGGLLCYCTSMNVVVHDLEQSRVRWTVKHGRRLQGPLVWMGTDRLLVMLRGQPLIMFDLESGDRITEMNGMQITDAVQDRADRWILWGQEQCLALGADGVVQWRIANVTGANNAPRPFQMGALSADHLILMSGYVTPRPGESNSLSAAKRSHWVADSLGHLLVDRDTGDVVARIELSDLPVHATARPVFGGVVVSGEGKAWVVTGEKPAQPTSQ